jgi:NAD(P)-dependent dehydrogenase (short-subunit alcohol dehydrogenase family)
MLDGSVALVTGSTRGIGRAVALELASQGADVGVNCRAPTREADAVCEEIRRMGRRVTFVPGDTRVEHDVDRMVAQVSSELGAPDILVNNAVYALQKRFLDFTVDEWRSQIEYKALAYFLTAQRVLPTMLQRGRGAIVNVLSTVGLRGGNGEAGYAVTNGGAMALTRALACEFGEQGIRVNGVMLTWAENAFDSEDPEHRKWLDRFALRRVTRLHEVARTVAFLASPQAEGITGALIPVDAGYLCV